MQQCPEKISAIVITVSDRCARGLREDLSGPAACAALTEAGCELIASHIVADGISSVTAALKEALSQHPQLIFTTGGTGITPRDLTPEATSALITTRIPGLEDKIRRFGEANTPFATLSRVVVGIYRQDDAATLIVNAPGSVGGVKDTVAVIAPLLSHLVEQMRGGDH